MTEPTRICPGCGRDLPDRAYGRDRSREASYTRGRAVRCRECRRRPAPPTEAREVVLRVDELAERIIVPGDGGGAFRFDADARELAYAILRVTRR